MSNTQMQVLNKNKKNKKWIHGVSFILMQKSICNIILAQLHIVNGHAEIKQSSYFCCVLPCYLLSSLHFWHTRIKTKEETEAKDRESRSGMGAVGKEGVGGGVGGGEWGGGTITNILELYIFKVEVYVVSLGNNHWQIIKSTNKPNIKVHKRFWKLNNKLKKLRKQKKEKRR